MSEERDDVIRQKKERYRDAYGEHWRIKWDMDQSKNKLSGIMKDFWNGDK